MKYNAGSAVRLEEVAVSRTDEMKVTVCFEAVRVVVPCGEGDILVRELIHKATTRYKKATAKRNDSWVRVHNLKQLDGGILDPDDRLRDVADDREQIIALYEERHHHHHTGDGTSASSDSENPSPDIFQDIEHKFSPFTRNDIEITGEELNATPPPLHVRRGSEPALNRLSPIPPINTSPDPTKRWSAAPIIEDQSAPPCSTPMKTIVHDGHNSFEDDSVFVGDPGERGEGSGEEKTPSSSTSSHHSATTAFTRFSRDTNRCSVQVLSDNPAMARWADAADNALVAVAAGGEGRRREPLGGSASSPMHSRDPSHDDSPIIVVVVMSNDRGPLGIHVIPSTDGRGRDQGLLVEGVEPGGRIARDGRIEVHDRIVEINGRHLNNITFQKAQEIFKDAMMTPELRLRVVKRLPTNHHHHHCSNSELVEGEERLVGGAKLAAVTSTRKTPGSSLSSRTQAVILQSNTRKLGRRLRLHLTKGPHGLGFSITTRDNPAGGEAPIYIKNILPKGAAIEDGTLHIGDRLLEVNGVEVTGRSQSEVAGLLRQIPIGGTAKLTVSRQEQRAGEGAGAAGEALDEVDKPPSPKLPRQLLTERATEDSLMFPWRQREILMFEIPVHDSERAGLGVSVKGKTSSGPNGSVDLGIFVKNVIHGGAASRDGRLLQNDQLVNINSLSLLGKPNSEAMKTLRTAMHQEFTPQGPTPGMISLTVARRIDQGRTERSSPSSANRSGRESANSLLTNSSGTETLGGAKSAPTTPTPDHHSGTGGHSSDTAMVMFSVNKDQDDRYDGDRGEFLDIDQFDVRNPVIQRLTNNNGALRNESYYKATHDTWNASQLQHLIMRGERETLGLGGSNGDVVGPGRGGNGSNPLGSPTINLPSRDTLIIHDDPATTNLLTSPLRERDGHGAFMVGSLTDHPSHSDDAYTSQTSLEENGGGFSRDQFGRQSISEKRHATLDAKNTDTYQRNKKAREEREKQKQMMLAQDKIAVGQGLGPAAMAASRNRDLLGRDAVGGPVVVRASSEESLTTSHHHHHHHVHQPPSPPLPSHEHDDGQEALRSRLDYGPGLGMKKSSSLESLQTMVQEMALEEEGQRMGSGRVPRGRGCNESFRAAVDRSYDVPLNTLRAKMETLAEEESESSGSGFGRGNSRQSSVQSTVAQDCRATRGQPTKPGRKKPGLFKGLGSMFRFGKHRKGSENSKEGESRGSGGMGGEMDAAEMERLAAARRLQQEEHDHMQEQYRRLIESTAARSQSQQQQQGGGSRDGMLLDEAGEPSRSERMHQLRAEHQRRHAQRNRTYPTDDSEERYETVIRQRLDPVPSEPKPPEPRHVRSHSYDLYGNEGRGRIVGEGVGGMGRPGSRMAYADPHKYSHYVNYEQIQQHLRKNKEQERLKKLASQQYQDFRDKQTRRQDGRGTLLNRLEETFIHESILSSRESREYQSQRGPRDSQHHPRPVSNYYEYESVQAMISHARDPSTTLPRPRHPHPAPPPPPHQSHPPTALAQGNMSGNNNNPLSSSMYPGSSQPHHLTLYKQQHPSSYHPNNTTTTDPDIYPPHPPPPSSSYHRPTSSHYPAPPPPSHHHHHHHNKPPPPPPHNHHTTKITVPGSKV